MKHLTCLLLTTLMLAATPTAAQAQKEFTLEDLNFGGTNYRNMIPQNRNYIWHSDKLLRLNDDTCWTVTPRGKEKVLFTRSQLNDRAALPDSLAIRSLAHISFPYPDSSLVMASCSAGTVLIDVNKPRIVWQQHREAHAQAQLWSSTSRAVAYVSNNDLYVTDAHGATHRITSDGSRDIVYGQAVHRNEFGIEGGLFWSPDGHRLAFYRMDQSMVTDYPLINVPELDDSTQVAATPAPEKYPMAGQASHMVTVGIYDLDSHAVTYLDAGDPTDRYFTNISWSPAADVIYMFELNRDQNDCRLVAYNAGTGHRMGEIYRETHDRYVEPQNPITFLPWDSNRFVMQSRRDGYNHLYLMDTGGNIITQLTRGEWEVMELIGFDTTAQAVIIAANAHSPIGRNIYRVDVATGSVTCIDHSRGGWHNASLSHSGEWIVDNYQEPDVPRIIALANTRTAQSLKLFTAPDPWQGYTVPEYRCGTITAADGTTPLYYRMVMPTHFDPTKKYPTVVYVYGGPHAHNVDARWHYASRSWETYMAQRGYLLFILDNRGSENRGRDFEQATFRRLGQVEMSDQMCGVEFLRTLPYVDTTRLGVHGWSFGGFMTISLMTNYPDVFKAGVAGGPVIDWKWYEVMYGERYMDTPQDNPDGYARTSLIGKAKDLKGRLQIIIGLNDPTVVPQHAYSFLKACIAAGTQPDFYVYPGQGHNMMGHQSVHLHERITRYFDDYLK